MSSIVTDKDLVIKKVSNGWVLYKIDSDLSESNLQFFKFVSSAEEMQEIIGGIEESENNLYRPLPPSLIVSQSKIQGSGLFAETSIKAGTEFGITHIRDKRFQDGYIRTPLGGFFNHSDQPNAEAYIDGDYIRLRSIRDMKKGDEVTVRYWLYNIKEILC